ncbi:MAG: glycosyltransferase [Breznakibacter sp.]
MIKVLIICTSLGKIKRGFEVSADQLFVEISKEPEIETYIAQQSTTNFNKKKRITVKYIHRGSKLYNLIKKLKSENYADFVHEVSFAIMLLPWILIKQPNVVYYTEPRLGNFLFHARKKLNLKYKLFFSNGAPYPPEVYKDRCDFIQQKVKWTFDIGIENGVSPQKMDIIPNGFYLKDTIILNDNEKSKLKIDLGYSDKIILLAVGAINSHHKRINYIIEESESFLINNNAILICIGQITNESYEIQTAFQHLIIKKKLIIKTVTPHEVNKYYQIADLFIHASLFEGFGRSIVEALSYGCKCILHEFVGFREIANDTALYITMSQKGELERAINNVLINGYQYPSIDKIKENVVNKFDWSTIRHNYIKIFQRICQK